MGESRKGTKGSRYKGTIRALFRLRASVPRKYREGNRIEYPSIELNDGETNQLKPFPRNSYHTTKYVA